ncbi:MAG: hypothetical protein HY644_12845 [Acidobacteria bacterium]|nr:hypothetical protein [Acidobacteriota bacterium]
MAEKVERTGVKREKGYVYFINQEGDICRAKMGQKGNKERIRQIGLHREKGFLYFIDAEGDISRSPLKRHK